MENLKFDFSEIRSATSNFANDNKLGEGGFGEVFKVVLVLSYIFQWNHVSISQTL